MIPNHSSLISTRIQRLKKIGKNVQDIALNMTETDYQHKLRALAMCLFDDKYTPTISKHSFPKSM